jgi:hypothetical protein
MRESRVMTTTDDFPCIPDETLDRLLIDGRDAWDEFGVLASERFHRFIPCDHAGAYLALRKLRDRASTFVEFGSASGVVTIIADLLGYEAVGIELEPWLVERSLDIAERFHSGATFVEGSFVPLEFQDDVVDLSPDFHTPTVGACAYEELGIGLDDFDLVFAYPWPGEEDWLREILRRFARPETLLLTYDVAEGFRVGRCTDAPRAV